jgi:hypothetical protein
MIGLPKCERSERRKWSCPFCGSSDALHAYPGAAAGFGCWAACGADQPKLCRGYSIVDVASAHWRITPADACRRLADELGIVYDDDSRDTRPHGRLPVVRERAPRVEGPSDQDRNLAALSSVPGACYPPNLYGDLLDRLTLTFRGERYLSGRRLDPAAARAYGYRSIDDPGAWTAVARHLEGTYRAEELAAAGFPLTRNAEGKAAVTLPFNGRLPALLIPFRRRGQLVSIRFRNVLPDDSRFKHNRYRTLKAAKPLWPYNADALRGSTVHICEGELNAETLRQLGENAAGPYGAGAWLDHWTPELGTAAEIVDWHDCRDPLRAGDLGAAALRTRLVAAYGEAWVARRWRRMMTDTDPNGLHQQDRLVPILLARPWMDPTQAEVHVA